jgi:hypothetical protein
MPLPDDATCAGCGYPLRGLPAHRCPECGRAFHPNDLSSFAGPTAERAVADKLGLIRRRDRNLRRLRWEPNRAVGWASLFPATVLGMWPVIDGWTLVLLAGLAFLILLTSLARHARQVLTTMNVSTPPIDRRPRRLLIAAVLIAGLKLPAVPVAYGSLPWLNAAADATERGGTSFQRRVGPFPTREIRGFPDGQLVEIGLGSARQAVGGGLFRRTRGRWQPADGLPMPFSGGWSVKFVPGRPR